MGFPLALVGGIALGSIAKSMIGNPRPLEITRGLDTPVGFEARNLALTPSSESPILAPWLDVVGGQLDRLTRSEIQRLKDAGYTPEVVQATRTELTRGKQESLSQTLSQMMQAIEGIRTESIFRYLNLSVEEESAIRRAQLAQSQIQLQADASKSQAFLSGFQSIFGGGGMPSYIPHPSPQG